MALNDQESSTGPIARWCQSSVVIKAHGSHPALSRLKFDAMQRAAKSVDAPDGVLGILFGTAAGARLVAAPQITAVGFAGSLGGGHALMDIIARRDEPIPFYGELSSLSSTVIRQVFSCRGRSSMGVRGRRRTPCTSRWGRRRFVVGFVR